MTWCQGTGTKKGRSLGDKENSSQGQSSVIHPSVSRDLGGDLRSQVSAGTQPGSLYPEEPFSGSPPTSKSYSS